MVGMRRVLPVIACFVLCLPAACRADGGTVLDIEGGGVLSGYNDVRIPGSTGTLFSLVDDLETGLVLDALFESTPDLLRGLMRGAWERQD